MTLKEVLVRMKVQKKEIKTLRDAIKAELAHNGEYRRLSEDLKATKQKMKTIENLVASGCVEELRKIDGLKDSIESDKYLATDIALKTLVSGESVQVEDENGTKYVPEFTAKFKKLR